MVISAYEKLESVFHEVTLIGHISSILHWDAAVMLPSASYKARGEQNAYLAKLSHQKLQNKELQEYVNEAGQLNLNDWQQANLKLMERSLIEAQIIPDKLVEALTQATIESEVIWRQARKENNFKLLAPYLEKSLELTKKVGQIKADHYNISVYDALLDSYDRGRTGKQLDEIFKPIKEQLPPLVEEIRAKQADKKADLTGDFPIHTQKEIAMEMMRLLGFDFNTGRIDTSAHPFCGGNPYDIRLTTRYDETDLISGLMGIMHETGHALYESSLPKEWIMQPVGSSLGMSIHESQSLFVELQICHSPHFIEFLSNKLQPIFGQFSQANLQQNLNYVEPSLIRVDADEVTYPLHVVLRYNLEKAMLEGDLRIQDLPSAWNEGMRNLLGITPSTESDGCMQDIHWPMGGFGYFPTYALGATIAAQLKYTLLEESPHIFDEVKLGNFAPIMAWLKKNIHSKGSLYTPSGLVKEVTGEDINPHYLIKHFKQRYLTD